MNPKSSKRIGSWKDLVLAPFVLPAGLVLKRIRQSGLENMPLCRKILLRIGVMPIVRHYYEPLFHPSDLVPQDGETRKLPGMEFHVPEQLELLRQFRYSNELRSIPATSTREGEFYSENSTFGPGDYEFFYNLVRLKKPRRIFEIGSGFSTLIARMAIQMNLSEDDGYACDHVCIEPYEMPWLEKSGPTVIRKKVEDVGTGFFAGLGENDILFIDSSHMIRPQGDVLFEFLELLPTLNKGVIVHIHDIYTPRDYPANWMTGKHLFWNEQYLLEAFLNSNWRWKIIGAVNHLFHQHKKEWEAHLPALPPERNPGSFYIQKIS